MDNWLIVAINGGISGHFGYGQPIVLDSARDSICAYSDKLSAHWTHSSWLSELAKGRITMLKESIHFQPGVLRPVLVWISDFA